MRILKFFLLLILLFTFPAFARAGQGQKEFDPGAVWNPTMSQMDAIRQNCGLLRGDELNSCLIGQMQSANASSNAISFTKAIGGAGFMKAYKPLGIVDAALVYYPFSLNHEGCILINGQPGIINTDDTYQLNIQDLMNNPDYISLAKKYSRIAIFPGDRSGNDYPYKINLPDNSQRIVLNYTLRDGCSSCELLGYAEFGFDFDGSSKFTGTKFLSLKKSVTLDSVVTQTGSPANVFSDPSQTIEVNSGSNFSVALQSNHSAGLKWELADSLNEKVVTLLGSNFLIPNETLPNAAGKEIWNFKAAGKGSAVIKFNYIRDWQGSEKIYSQMVFNVNVN